MLDDIRDRLRQITDTVPVPELSEAETKLDEVRCQLWQVVSGSDQEHVRQALGRLNLAHEKTGEALQAMTLASDHTRDYTTAL
ncbi:hypothetical protein SAMN04487904_103280 [Actinopolyspora lacussalsi subsp. righensis]|uniref:Uncharacterized protein n=1 Tax=Actinopolyspora righensis TaxID=995060 RepID=A0A1I6YVB7_9ACTN|nr:hypothetical protein [Actinopolyspora righensis]SFT54465.1 hypothetical protein SAMN04487904_103280 [Actinopolyspora righensis]